MILDGMRASLSPWSQNKGGHHRRVHISCEGLIVDIAHCSSVDQGVLVAGFVVDVAMFYQFAIIVFAPDLYSL